mgnify:CR=1 FL=1
MQTTNMEAVNMILERISEDFMFLSDNAKNFIKGNMEEDGLEDFLQMVQVYQRLAKDSEQYDDFDNTLLINLQFLARLLKTLL